MALNSKKKKTYTLHSDFEDESERVILTMSDSTELLILRTYAPAASRNGFTILMIAGWGSIVPGWNGFLNEARDDFDIVYLETREKASSTITKHSVRGSIQRLSSDLQEVIELLQLEQKKLILFGSCMGANIIADGLVQEKFDVFKSILLGPQPKWPIPKISRVLLPLLPKRSLTLIKPFLKYWVVHTQCDTEETAAKYARVLDEAISKKWHHVGKPIALDDYTEMYSKVTKPVVIVVEEGDKTHIPEESLAIAKSIKKSEIIYMESNKAAHSEKMVIKIREIIKFE